MTMFDFLPVMDRILVLRARYFKATGTYPTRLVMRPSDFAEFEDYRREHEIETYIAPPAVPQPEVLGMTFIVAEWAKEMEVYFKES